jgi:hypothetical protein
MTEKQAAARKRELGKTAVPGWSQIYRGIRRDLGEEGFLEVTQHPTATVKQWSGTIHLAIGAGRWANLSVSRADTMEEAAREAEAQLILLSTVVQLAAATIPRGE